jgi:myo-inositol-1(or 4)-monophosphatase
MQNNRIQDLLQVAVQAAQLSGAYLLKNRARAKTVDTEKAHDIKLSIDRFSERRIVQYLKKHSHFPILSEEAGMLKGKDPEFYWVVDPLDGTINYFHQIPLSCVSIALCRGEQPVLGVIYDFTRNELFTGVADKGAYLNGRRIHVSQIKSKRQAVLATGFPSQTSLSAGNLSTFCSYVKAYKKVRLLGTAALSMAYVAGGRLDAYIEKDIMLWDVAAGIAIVQAAGGQSRIHPTKKRYSYHVTAHNGFLGN